jgi:D-tyrosyl-tRNA(Tyr) deacylase
MRVLVQRVKSAYVIANGQICGAIEKGLLVFLGIHKLDAKENIDWMVRKLVHLRIFSDSEGKMNLNIREAKGNFLMISQFTLYGNCLNGRRPDFIEAAPHEQAQRIYDQFLNQLGEIMGHPIQSGIFGTTMEVHPIIDGPVTFLIEK